MPLGMSIPPEPPGKGYKLCNLPIIYMKDLTLGKGECLILGVSEKARGIMVRLLGMLRGMLNY